MARVSQHHLTLHGNYQRWDVVFLQKCSYKLQPRKCLGLGGANLIISTSKNGEKTSKFHKFFMFFSFFKNNSPSCEILPQKKSRKYIVVKVATFCQCASLKELNVFEFLK